MQLQAFISDLFFTVMPSTTSTVKVKADPNKKVSSQRVWVNDIKKLQITQLGMLARLQIKPSADDWLAIFKVVVEAMAYFSSVKLVDENLKLIKDHCYLQDLCYSVISLKVKRMIFIISRVLKEHQVERKQVDPIIDLKIISGNFD